MTHASAASHAGDTAGPARRTGPEGGALVGLALPMLMASLDTSIANAALPTLARAFAAPFHAVQWIVLAYLLALTTMIVGVGRYGDLLGRRRLLLAGIGLFTAASLLCGLAPTLGLLIAARAAQGLGAAVMMALTLAAVGESVPAHVTGRTIGLLGTMSAVGTALGPSLGGGLVATLGWRAIFLVNVPLGLLALALVRRHLPAGRRPAAGRAGFDHPGTLLLALTLAAFALAVTRSHGAAGPSTAVLLAVAACGAALFALVETKAASPLIHVELFREPRVGASLVMGTLVATVMMSTLVVGPFYLAGGLGLGVSLVGLALSVGPLVVAVSGVPAGRAVDRLGTRRMTRAGLAAMAAGSVLLSAAPRALGLLGYLLPIVLVTAGYALFQTSNNTAVLAAIPPERKGLASGLLGLSRNLGLISGASLMGAVFAWGSGASDITAAAPEAVAAGMRLTFGLAALLMGVALAVATGCRALVTRSVPLEGGIR